MQEVVRELIAQRVVGVLRLPRSDLALRALEVAIEHGVTAVEVTLTTPNALEILSEARKRWEGRAWVGAGTVLDAEHTRQAIEAGAQFVVSPILDAGMVEAALEAEIPPIPGVFSPTEIVTAHRWGAPIVKVFPAVTLGTAFFKEVKAPLPGIPLMAVGGIHAHNAAEYLHAGADMVGVGGALFPKTAILAGEFEGVAQAAEALAALRHLRDDR
ncbi:MAG: bifunctional 4-hydroxy-2-oxoglutarate aldolase/2-dehydro-3-deoxy-phosphogluconate aldolase [Armatimonadota bacterium]|nr:bifunctional 4-hydroxy-2-oxoglutarate aldolase/2-dehydro-3-deoxy-phosphogluconate aldolase [Armatimonadota bacterium]